MYNYVDRCLQCLYSSIHLLIQIPVYVIRQMSSEVQFLCSYALAHLCRRVYVCVIRQKPSVFPLLLLGFVRVYFVQTTTYLVVGDCPVAHLLPSRGQVPPLSVPYRQYLLGTDLGDGSGKISPSTLSSLSVTSLYSISV